MSNLDPQATPFVPAYNRMFYPGPVMPPHAVHGAPPPNTAFQSPGGDMKRTPLNPQAPAFVPGAGIGFRPGSTATFAHGRVQLPSHAFPPQQQSGETVSSPPAARAFVEATPPPTVEETQKVTRTETWAAKVKKAVAADQVPVSSAVGESTVAVFSPTAKDPSAAASPKPVKSKATPKAARAKGAGKSRASKLPTVSEPTGGAAAAAKSKPSTKGGAKTAKATEKGTTSQKDAVPTTDLTEADEKAALTPIGAETSTAQEKPRHAKDTKSQDKARGGEEAASPIDKTSKLQAEQSAPKTQDKPVAKVVEQGAASVKSLPTDKPAEEIPEKPRTKALISGAKPPAKSSPTTKYVKKSSTDEATVTEAADPLTEKADVPLSKLTSHKAESSVEASDRCADEAVASASPVQAPSPAPNNAKDEAASPDVAEIAPTKSDSLAATSEQPEVEPKEQESIMVGSEVSTKQVVRREGLHTGRPSASSRVSALLGNTDDDDVTGYQPLSSRAPFSLKSGGSYGLKQRLQHVVAGLGSYGAGGLDKLDAETTKKDSFTTESRISGERSVPVTSTEQPSTVGTGAVGGSEPQANIDSATTPSFTYTLSANNVKVYRLQDMLSIRHLPQCNRQHKPSSPSALFGMRNTVVSSSTAIFDIPSALGHKHRGLDRMLEEGSNSNWNLRTSKDAPFRSGSHGGAGGAGGGTAAAEMPWIRRAAAEVPEVPKDSWQAQQAASKVNSDRNVKLQRKLKAQLNKMTPATYEDIFKAIMHLGIETIEEAQLFVNLVFEKAITNHQYIDMYAKLCSDLQNHLESKGVVNPESGSDFRRMLVQCCQTAFENNLQKPFEAPEGAEEEETFEALLLYKKKMKGNLVFVSALSMQRLVGARVLLSILTKLIDNKDSVQLEALAAFLPTVANSLDASRLKEPFEDMFTRIRALSQDPEVEHRIRCLLLDCVEQRDKDLRRNEHQQFRKVQSHAGGSGFHSVLAKTRTYQ